MGIYLVFLICGSALSFIVLAQVGIPHLRLGAAPGTSSLTRPVGCESDNYPTTEMSPEASDSGPMDYAPYLRTLIRPRVAVDEGQSASRAGALRSPLGWSGASASER